MPREKRNAMEVLYAFMRYTDDLVDEEIDRSTEERAQNLVFWSQATKEILENGPDFQPTIIQLQQQYPTLPGIAILPALKFNVDQFAIPHTVFSNALEGAKCDLEPKWNQTWNDCEEYCHQVATSVGIASLAIWGVSGPINSSKVNDYAEKTGLAIQLTNIVRDLREDLLRGRFYLPYEELVKAGLDASDLRFLMNHDPSNRQNAHLPVIEERLIKFDRFIRSVLERVDNFYSLGGQPLYELVSADSKGALGLILAVYMRLSQKIGKNPRLILFQRVRLSFWEKLQLFFFPKPPQY